MTSQSPSKRSEPGVDYREVIFISHATPEDNAFTIWLGAKLAAMGYEVWADVLRIKGGDDWQRKLEIALHERACEMLLVANPRAVNKQGVRNEIQIASDVARKIGDSAFIIPLRMESFEAPFLIAHAQYIDFARGWTRGLAELLITLQDTYRVPRNAGHSDTIWRDIQLIHAKAPVDTPEEDPLLRIQRTPIGTSGPGADQRDAVAAKAHSPRLPYLRSLPRSATPFRTASSHQAESGTARHRLSG